MARKVRVSAIVLLLSFWCTPAVYALSPEAETGKQFFPVCNSCHNADLEPPLAPPMWGVQRRYKKSAKDEGHFISLIAEFAKQPSMEKAKFKHAVSVHGLMPAVALPEQTLRAIATYIAEESFPPPCAHWRNNLPRVEAAGETAHAQKDRSMLKKFCE